MSIKIKISDDQLSVKLSLSAAGKEFPTADEVLQSLRARGISHGIDQEMLTQICKRKKTVENITIAVGTPPEISEDPAIEWLIDRDTGQKPAISNDGIANFKKIKTFEPVTLNQPLARIASKGEGKPGKNVLGVTLPPYYFALSKMLGTNTHLSDDGMTLLSELDGYVFYTDNRINVDRVYHIKGGVNYATGNVNFDGTIIIDGDVRSGFRVEATENIFISGNVEAAEVYSYKGDIAVKHGVLGKGRAKVVAGGSLICGFLQDTTVGVNGDVIISHYAINSKIIAGSSVLLEENEGLIRGGKIKAEEKICATEIGSEQNIRTDLFVGLKSVSEPPPELAALRKKLDRLQIRYSLKSKLMAFNQILEKESGHLSPEKSRELIDLRNECAELKNDIEGLKQDETKLEKQVSADRSMEAVVVKGTLHSGVNVSIGKLNYFVEKPMTNVKLLLKDNEIIPKS
ncbi:MAG: DUF342 domain-containing protein [FCB group bacterium]|nr:DUF342 domain-containing protein [FCB group bacterium]